MFSINTLEEIMASLKHNVLRTVLTGLSVSWGIFILIILLAAGNGLQNGVTSNFSSRATNSIQLTADRTSKPYRGFKGDRNLNFTDSEKAKLQSEFSELTGYSAVVNSYLSITYKNEGDNFSVNGIEPAYAAIRNFEIYKGRSINSKDIEEQAKVIVLDRKVVDKLFKNKEALGEYVKVGNIVFRVVGINDAKSRWGSGNAYIPFSTAQSIFNTNKKYRTMTMLVEGVESKEANEALNASIRSSLSSQMTFDPTDEQAVWVWNNQQNYVETMKIFSIITFFVAFIGILTLIAGIVGVSNIMLVSVKERTREIGIRKAIGASPATILRSIVLESLIITTIFGYIGMFIGIAIVEVVNVVLQQSTSGGDGGMQIFKDPSVPLNYVFIATAILVVSGVIAGYLPARRAVRIKPIEAMREE